MTDKKALVLLSGGQDSTTCLYWAIAEHGRENVRALTVLYGQRHATELTAARTIAELAGVEHTEVVVPGVLLSTSPLVDHARDVQEYADADSLPGGIEDTFVPLRNLFFLTIAANHAVHHGCSVVVIGVSEEDFGGYPDCREAFLGIAEATAREALGQAPHASSSLRIARPLVYLDKAQTVRLAWRLPGCMEALAHSHTCYKGERPPCGKCHACLLRAKGFAEADVPDPLFR